MINMKKIMKDSKNAKFLGVCSGLSREFGINVKTIRAIFIIVGVLSAGNAFLIYLLLALIMPNDIQED